MARRSGQNGSIERKGGWWYVRYWLDVPGKEKRKHVCERLGPAAGKNKLNKSARERLAKERIEQSGTNSSERFRKVEALNTGTKFRDQAEIWLKQAQTRKRRPIKPHTVSTWRSHLVWINSQIGDLPLTAVNNLALKELVAKMAICTKPGEPEKPRYSAKTINNYAQIVKVVVASAIDENGEELYPRKWNHEFIDLPEVKDQRTPIFTAEEIGKILSDASGQHFVLYALLGGTGMRIGESLALEIPDVSSDCRTISIRQSIWNGVLQTPKTRNGFRDVDLCSELATLLKQLIGTRQSGFVFQTANGKPLSATNILKRDLHETLETAGIEQAGFHSFRRYRVTYLRKNRVPEDLLRFWIGHADKSVTDGYSKLKEDVEFRRTIAEQIGVGFEIPMQKTALLSECPKTQIFAMSASC